MELRINIAVRMFRKSFSNVIGVEVRADPATIIKNAAFNHFIFWHWHL